ncbi:hypothetical protein GOP47_0022045 [Adiantum capillus-veneris]|uniref:Uncharacterized protein n=1 Tax=Adiantum capillus-veneris TaxID=13818 RepID=A0A9D4U9J2_ADICA|nr:hypothetical protein GOP47_0022045 [Adiantum capillus-veneris]
MTRGGGKGPSQHMTLRVGHCLLQLVLAGRQDVACRAYVEEYGHCDHWRSRLEVGVLLPGAQTYSRAMGKIQHCPTWMALMQYTTHQTARPWPPVGP